MFASIESNDKQKTNQLLQGQYRHDQQGMESQC